MNENEKNINKLKKIQNDKSKLSSKLSKMNCSLESKDNIIIKFKEEIENLKFEIFLYNKNVRI